MPGTEAETPISIGEWALTDLGYGEIIGQPIPSPDANAPKVLAEDFLDLYPAGSQHRQDTEDLLEGYREMDPTDPDYEGTRRLILRYFKTWFGPPPSET